MKNQAVADIYPGTMKNYHFLNRLPAKPMQEISTLTEQDTCYEKEAAKGYLDQMGTLFSTTTG
jgi:hypothetical protein